MSTSPPLYAAEIGVRLAEQIAAAGGVTVISRSLGVARNTIYNWMAMGNIPAPMLITLSKRGIDVQYVLFGGQPSSDPRPAQPAQGEKNLLSPEPIDLTGLPESVRLALAVITDYLRTSPSPSPDRRDNMIYLTHKHIEMVLSPALAGALSEQLRSPSEASVELTGPEIPGYATRERIHVTSDKGGVTLCIGPVFFDLTLTEATELADQIDTKMRAAA